MSGTMNCYACGATVTNDSALTNFAKWTTGYIDGARQPYCAYDGWCEDYTLKAETGGRHFGTTGQERDHIRAQVDPWFAADHECDERCDWLTDADVRGSGR